MTSPSAPIVIAGAGIAGMTLALALLRRGIDVEVYEQASELRQVGAGLQIGPNGSSVLIDVGVRHRLEGRVCEASSKEVRMWDTGQAWKLFDLGQDCLDRFGSPYWTVHRADLHDAIVEAVRDAKPDCLRLGTQVSGFDQDEASATVYFTDGTSATGSCLIGADGVHSTIRAGMGFADRPHFTGMMAWRGQARMDALSNELRRNVGTNWIGPGRHVVTYPMRGGSLLNFVGIVEGRDWPVESWNERGTNEECLADFVGWHPLVQELIGAIETPFKWAFPGRDPMMKWAQGRVCLIGDACHPTLPFLAQGANMALEDALVLARCIESSRGDLTSALLQFEAARVERTASVVRKSTEMGRRFHNPALGSPDTAIAYVEKEWEPQQVRFRYDWLYDYSAASVELPEVAGSSRGRPGAIP